MESARLRILLMLVPTLISALGMPLTCLGEEYLPLDLGNTWEYEGSEGGHERQTVTETVDIWGMSAWVVLFSESTQNGGLRNYWMTEPDGDVLLRGFDRGGGDLARLYDPPLRMLDAPLFVGKTWSTKIQVYSLPDTVLLGTFTFSFEVYEEGTVSVPAGDFHAFGIGTKAPTLARGYSFLGTVARESKGGESSTWYSDGIGEVRYLTDQRYDLLTYGQASAVLSATWGSIKQQYRLRREGQR